MRARHRIRDYLHGYIADGETIDDVVLAVEEAMTNAVRHSRAAGDVAINLGFEGPDLHVEVRDRGVGFDVSSFDASCLPDCEGDGGRGLYLIASLMDELQLESSDGLALRAVKRDALRPRDDDGGVGAALPGGGESGYRDARRKAMLDEMDESFIALDWEYRCVHANTAALQQARRALGEVVGQCLWDLWPRLRDTPQGRAVRDAMELGAFSFGEYQTEVAGDWVEARFYPTGSGVSIFARVITERRRAEDERHGLVRALQDSEQRYAALFERSPFAVALSQLPDNRIVNVNDAFLELFQFGRDEILGRTSPELGIADEASRSRIAEQLAAAGFVHEYEVERRTKSGESRALELSLDPLEIGGEPHILTTIRDITRRRRAEAALKVHIEEQAATLEELQAIEEELRATQEQLLEQNDALQSSQQALRESNERFRMALRSAPVSVATQDLDLRYTWAFNQRTARPDEIIGHVDAEIFTAQEAERFTAAKLRVIREDVELRDQLWLERPTGPLFIDVSWTPLHDEAGTVTGVGSAVVDLTEAKLAEEQLRDHAKRLHLLQDVTLAASAALGLPAIAEAVLEALRRHLELEGGDIRVLDDTRLRLVSSFDYPQAHVDLISDADVATSPLLGARAIRRRRLLTHEDERLTPERLRLLERQGVLDDRYVYVPVEHRDRILGLLSLTFAGRRAFRDDELDMYTAVAQVVGQAVANGRLYEAERRRAGRMAALKQIAETTGSSLRVQDVGDRLIAAVRPLLGTAHALVALESDGHLTPISSSGYPDGFVDEHLTPLPDASLVAQAWRAGAARFIEDRATAELSAWSRDMMQRLEHGSFLALPLLHDRRPFGAVGFIWSQPRRFDADEVSFLESIVAAAATSLQNARLFEAELRARKQARRELATSQALLEAAGAIAGWAEPEHIATRLARLMLQLTRRRRVLVHLWLEGRDDVELVAAEGDEAPPLGSIRLDECSPGLREALTTGHTVVAHPAHEPRRAETQPDDAAFVPIVRRGGVVGAIVLDDPGGGRAFRQRDIRLAEGIAAQAAVAMENAALFEEAKARDHLSTALNQINELIHSTLHVKEILQGVLERARQAVGSDSAMLAVRHGDDWVAEYGSPEVPDVLGERVGTDEAPFILTAVDERSPVAIDDCAHDPRCIPAVQARFGVRSVLCIPLITHDDALGVIFFNHHEQATHFEPRTIDFAGKLAVAVSSALENARLFEEQQRIATTLQENFLHPLPAVPGLEFAVRSLPANQPELVGGDFSDVFVLPDGNVAVIIADVAGKGLRAAGLTETVRSTIRAFAAIDSAPASILDRTNQLLLRYDQESHVTALIGVLQPRTGHLTLASAGHPAPVHLSPGWCRILDLPFGTPLGAFPTAYRQDHVLLTLDDYLVLYTDGVTEARHRHELFGEKRLVQVVESLRGRSAAEVAQGLAEAAVAFGHGLRDDLHIVVVRLA
jgi:PAS domain S-box-containing protein